MRSTKSLCLNALLLSMLRYLKRMEKWSWKNVQKTRPLQGYLLVWPSAVQAFWTVLAWWWRYIESKRSWRELPQSCGICMSHKTTTILANIDVTNRCNQACPVCLPTLQPQVIFTTILEQIKGMMQMLRNEKPVPCPAVQFAGGSQRCARIS